MPNKSTINKREANLHTFPKRIVLDDKITHISIGDLHGNALKLIYILLELGVMQLKDNIYINRNIYSADQEDQYKAIRLIYYGEIEKIDIGHLKTFYTIINHAEFNNKYTITLIGDELADRGSNDAFMIMVLKALVKNKVNIEFLLSNHSLEFIRNYENSWLIGKTDIIPEQTKSFHNMCHLIYKGLLQEARIRKDFQTIYIPNQATPRIKVISYTIPRDPKNNSITLFTHAPVGLETIEALANKCNVHYDDTSRQGLINTIDKVNKKIIRQFGMSLASSIDEQRENGSNISLKNPLYRIIWNRELDNELRTSPAGNFKVYFVHGHNGAGETKQYNKDPLPMFQNLDNDLGKYPGLEETGCRQLAEFDMPFTVEHFTRHSSDKTAQAIDKKELDAPEEKISEEEEKIVKPSPQQNMHENIDDNDDLIKMLAPLIQDYEQKFFSQKKTRSSQENKENQENKDAGDFLKPFDF